MRKSLRDHVTRILCCSAVSKTCGSFGSATASTPIAPAGPGLRRGGPASGAAGLAGRRRTGEQEEPEDETGVRQRIVNVRSVGILGVGQ